MTESNKTLIVELPPEDFAGRCETFCEVCGQLRLWLKREFPDACGNCGAPEPLVGGVGGWVLPLAREQWRLRRAESPQSPHR